MKTFRRLISPLFYCLFFLPAFMLSGQPAAKLTAGMSTERLERYDQFIQHQITENAIPGAAILIARNGEIVHQAAYGYRDVTKKTPMEANDLFYIQSMTKPIITAAFMMLYEEGHFLLTDPVSKYLPAFKALRVSKDPAAGIAGETEELQREITIADLLTHTAGLSHGLGSSRLDREIMQQMYMQPHADIAARVNSLLELPLIGQPGEQWYYSAAPDVLSVLIEQFSGKPTRDFLQERLFQPLEMEDTGYNVPEEDQDRVVRQHQRNDEGGLALSSYQAPVAGNTIWSGVNALYSTPADYFNFCQMLLNGGKWRGRRLLSRKTIELMTMNQIEDLYQGPGEGFGLGFAVVTDVAGTKLPGSEGVFYWSGANNTHFFVDPQEKIVAIFMTQLQPHTSFYHHKLRQLVYQAIAD